MIDSIFKGWQVQGGTLYTNTHRPSVELITQSQAQFIKDLTDF